MHTEWLLAGLAVLLALWLGVRRLRRRMARGEATEVERRFDNALRRFHVEIDRFKFTRQGSVKVLLNHDHAIWTEVERMAVHGQGDRNDLRLKVYRYTEEIVPFFRPLSYYGLGLTLARTLLESLYRLDFRPDEVAALKRFSHAEPRSVIYLMNHRSNADYVLAAYVLAEKLALSFAVGEWARVWPLEYLFKSFGSYFIRRGFRDPLYHTVLRRYVQLVTKNAVTQALFPEGGLSHDGRLQAAKIGLLDSILCAKEDRSFDRELLFVPVAVNYDRVLEDRALVAEARERRPPGSKLAMARHVGAILFGNVWKFSRRRIRKNG
ncbi:MAG: 1-acyl-sn-glycerol-3-phosphate acyltransferase, partial [Deltaproteobacteria bacterium]|nr:1-acyl-sn-glycerol-3-phosphate acyltransferase [Deltaproteobacteria bacterium]